MSAAPTVDTSPDPQQSAGATSNGAQPVPAWQVVIATALVCAAVGWFSFQLANPASYATPLYPPAGIALACALVYGAPAALGVALGSFVLVLNMLVGGNMPAGAAIAIALGIGVGSALQALGGRWLVRRFLATPLILGEPREIALFFALGGWVASLINATNSTVLLVVSGALPSALWLATWATWWSGDVLGVVVAAPVVLSVIGQPRSEWRPRRRAVGLTMTAALALLAIGITQISRLDAERIGHRIEREAVSAAGAIRLRMQEPLRTLEVTRGIFLASDEVTQQEMHRATQKWLYPPGPTLAVGWGERIARQVATAAALAPAPAASGAAAPAAGASGPVHGTEPFALLVRYVEPFERNADALGSDLLSDTLGAPAIRQAIDDGGVVAGAGFAPVTASDPPGATAVTLYAAVYRGDPTNVAARRADLQGVVFVTVRVDDAVSSALRATGAQTSICLVDSQPGAQPARLAGVAGCERDATTLQQVHALDFHGRQWQLRIQSPTRALAGMPSHEAWLFSVAGLLASGMLSALLLLLTGRAQRIELAVAERTRALSLQVHERELAEAALREGEQRFRSIFDNVSVGVVYADLNGVIRQVNSRYATLAGCSVDELVGTRVLDRMMSDDRVRDRQLTRQLIAGQIPTLRGHRRMPRADGSALWVQASVTVLRDAAGQPQHLVGVVEDISDQLRLVEAERAREAAEAANRAKSEFLSRMSHELRTPLNAMLGFAQLLGLDRQAPLAESQRVQVAQIQQAGWHLLEMINDVLDLSRVDADNLRLQIESLAVEPLLDAAWALLAAQASERGIVLGRALAPNLQLLGDATRVKQILTNLLSNAVKYNAEGGHIDVRARRVDDQVEITVSDNGAGMTALQMESLFEPFNRLGRERSAVQGTGIGLLISRRLAEMMGGTLVAHSMAGAGSSFVLLLPVAPPAAHAEQPGPTAENDTPQYRRRLVHYVEDNPTNVEVMRGILAQRPQVRMGVSVTGLDGLAAIRSRPPDVVLLDMHLPDIEGIDLLHSLKASPATARIPVVVVSADALAPQIEAALDAGAAHYLTKPIDIAELLRVLDEMLEEAVTQL